MLYTQANYYYTFGMNSQGDAYINRLISQYKEQKNYEKVDESYKTLIDIARKANNAGLVARTYDKYILWSDSVKALTAQDELNVLKRKYDDSLQTIEEKRQFTIRQAVHYHRTLHPCRTTGHRTGISRYRIASFCPSYPETKRKPYR